MTFFNETTLTATFSVNWIAVLAGFVTVAPGQQDSVGDELVAYHIKAMDASSGQFLAEANGIWGNAQVAFTWADVTGYKLTSSS